VLKKQRERLRHVGNRSDDGEGSRKLVELHDEIELLIIEAERERINDLYRRGKIRDEARRSVERDLDLRDAQVRNLQAEE